MEDNARDLQSQIEASATSLNIDARAAELADLQAQSQAPDFWNDSASAQNTMQQIAKLDAQVTPWQELLKGIAEVVELAALRDLSLESDLLAQLETLKNKFNVSKEALKFSGPYDDHDAILTLSAGAGGTDAQDWTQMLLRMYTRF